MVAAIGLLGLPAVAFAEDSLPHRLYSIEITGDEQDTAVSLTFDRDPELAVKMLRGPERLIVDLPATAFEMPPEDVLPNGLVQSIRYGAMDQQRSRMVIGMRGPFTLDGPEKELREDGRYTVSFDLNLASQNAFETALKERLASASVVTVSTPKSERLPSNSPERKPFTIVVDAGHGGIDTGARGRDGVKEKDITLAFSLELKRQLEKIEGARIVQTRVDDRFIALNERVRIGRQADADLFISIHADSVRQDYVRGATVYTISKKASDAMAARLADSENAVDSVAGIDLPEEAEEVSDILLDLTRRETKGFSLRFARKLVDSMGEVLLMIKRPHRHAGFRVLTAPDVPSVLIELGYLSNDKDESLLQDDEWRTKAASAIAAAVAQYGEVREASLR
ncbi:N-acetylmuramoyl-L-alanine amidase [Notoacmeibacter ruber]|uniref:N-acetylmuramoyl-L-alanine amidase n=1 Tax=Notoacmeibacter ruber TaxID=2670375 RepID=UPI001314FDB1|nr:N-acetylmuramoyl-L-alanine amidase [Notoacmeibacter ruber]